ncbi:unnamed protein product [Rotaria socialis]|nr:unnamed protein product [Rotaria socialis]
MENAERYKRDSELLLHIANQIKITVDSFMPQWRSIFIKDVQLGRSLNAHSLANYKPIHSLAEKFLTKFCKFSRDDPNFSVSYTVAGISTFQTNSTIKEQIIEICSKISDSQERNILISLIEAYGRDCRRDAIIQEMYSNQMAVTLAEEIVLPNENLTRIENQTIEKTKVGIGKGEVQKIRGDTNDLQQRKRIKSMKRPMDKLEAILKLEEEILENSKELTEAARNFVVTVV